MTLIVRNLLQIYANSRRNGHGLQEYCYGRAPDSGFRASLQGGGAVNSTVWSREVGCHISHPQIN